MCMWLCECECCERVYTCYHYWAESAQVYTSYIYCPSHPPSSHSRLKLCYLEGAELQVVCDVLCGGHSDEPYFQFSLNQVG